MVGPGAIRGSTSQHYPMEYLLKMDGCDCINFVREYVELKLHWDRVSMSICTNW